MIIESIIDLLPALPCPPWIGPPLPIAWGVRWQAKEEPEVKPPLDYPIWSGLSPRQIVSKVTVRKRRAK